jgi:hypothetical protein
VPAEAFGTDQRTVLVVTLPIGTPAEDVVALLSKAEELLPGVDEARNAERVPRQELERSADYWCRNHPSFVKRSPS